MTPEQRDLLIRCCDGTDLSDPFDAAVMAALARIEALNEALRKIAWLRPAGHTNNKLLMQVEDIAIAALQGDKP